ncbi:MAG: hypothetical protein PVG93_00095 [Phycisphaerales bacterium]|jgi:hypothetical protein
MSVNIFRILATFTSPEEIGVNPQSMLWMLPLAAAIAVVYKAIKMPKITSVSFIKQSVVLFGSIVAFIVATAVILCIAAYLATE